MTAGVDFADLLRKVLRTAVTGRSENPTARRLEKERAFDWMVDRFLANAVGQVATRVLPELDLSESRR